MLTGSTTSTISINGNYGAGTTASSTSSSGSDDSGSVDKGSTSSKDNYGGGTTASSSSDAGLGPGSKTSTSISSAASPSSGPGTGSDNPGSGGQGPGSSKGSGGSGSGESSSSGNGGYSSDSDTYPTAPVIILGQSTIIADTATNFVIGGQTLTPGGTVTIAGSGNAAPTTIYLPSGANEAVVNGVTQVINTAVLTIDSQTYTYSVISSAGFVIGSQTLMSGGVITVAGETLSLLPGGLVLIASGTNSITETLTGYAFSITSSSIGQAGQALGASPTSIQVRLFPC